ncbi:MAG: hypothetical protein AAGC86_02865 [Pseudomonadota bacterium]
MRRVLKTMAALWCLAAVLAAPAAAQTPEEIVRWMYSSLSQPGPAEVKGLAYLSAPAQRDQYFTRRMRDFYGSNESYGDDLALSCVDFAFDIPGQDFDAAEISRTIAVTGESSGDRMTVTARFTSFGQPAAIAYDFAIEDGFWRIDDIAGPGWRVSQIPCTPRSTATDLCFKTESDAFKLQPGASGVARFGLTSWQANGHSCGVSGTATPIEGGWMFERENDGQLCRLQLLRTAEGGVQLSDPEWACKTHYCGARAVLDGMRFEPASRADCATVDTERF